MGVEPAEQLTGSQIEDLWRLYRAQWWSRERGLGDIWRMLEHTDVVIALAHAETGRLVAFARVLTDYVYKALVNDVMVDDGYKGMGLGRQLMDAVLEHPALRSVRHFELYCLPDVVGFYAKWGFTDGLDGLRFMRLVRDS